MTKAAHDVLPSTASEPGAASARRVAIEMSKNELRGDLVALIEKHNGRVKHVNRSTTGLPKLLAVSFGPVRLPTVQLEIYDRERPEEPLEREQRLRIESDAAHDKAYKEMQLAVKEALVVQRRELMAEYGVTAAAPTSAESITPADVPPTVEGTRWSKKSFTEAVEAAIGAGRLSKCLIEREGSNVINLQDGDQHFKIVISMPRQK